MIKRFLTILLILLLCIPTYSKEVDDGYYTVLLIGVDARGSKLVGNTDVMMLLSYNKTNCEVSCVSLQRDTYIKDSDNNWVKINSIYSKGGIDKLKEVINKTYNVNITNYTIVNWKDVKNLIDTVGLLEIQLTDKEFEFINAYIHETALACGEKNPAAYYVERNVDKLVGIQAVAYGRLRLPDNDRKRMERQQLVMKSMLNNFLKLSNLQKLGTIKKLVDGVKTDFGPSEIFNVVKSANKVTLKGTSISPHADNYKALPNKSNWVCMPRNWCKESSMILNDLYGRFKTPTQYINDLEKESQEIRK